MEIQYSQDQLMIQETARRLLTKAVTQGRRQESESSASGYDEGLWSEVTGLGWQAAAGNGLSALDTLGVLCEEMGRSAAATPFAEVLASRLLLAMMPETELAVALAIEIGNGGIVIALPSHVQADVVGRGLRLSGAAQIAPWAQAARWVLAIAEHNATKTVVAVPTTDLRISPAKALDHHRVAVVELEGLLVPSANIVAAQMDLDRVVEWQAARGLLAAAYMVGAAEGALELTVGYTKERVQFGKAIGSFQAVQHGLADVKIQIESAWLATWEGLSAIQTESGAPGAAPLAQWLALRALQEAAVIGTQFHGGIGYIANYPMQYFYRLAGASHGRTGSQYQLLDEIAKAFVDPVPSLNSFG